MKKGDQSEKIPLLLSWRQDLLHQIRSWFGGWVLARVANIAMLAVLAIFVFISWRSLQFLTSGEGTIVGNVFSRLYEIMTSTHWDPEGHKPRYGMLAMIFGSGLVTFGAMLIAIPLSLATAVLLSDIVPFQVRQFVKPVLELLAAIPSVAFGFFALKVIAPWLQTTFGFPSGVNALNASLILAIMAVPTIASVAEDALTNLGRDIREASYALGATRFETMCKVAIPAAHNGIITAIVLGMMRSIGETMVVWMAAGNASNFPTPWYDLNAVFGNFGEAVRTMTATIAGDMGETPAGSIHRSALFTIGLLLFLFTLVLNILTESLSKRFKSGMGTIERDTRRHGFVRHVIWQVRKTIQNIIALCVWPLTKLMQLIARLISTCHAGMLVLIGQRWHLRLRVFLNHSFTAACFVSVLLLIATLFFVLVPLFGQGIEAFVFRGTVEHRLFLNRQFDRGDANQLHADWDAAQKARKPVYDLLDQYVWLNPQSYREAIKKLDRQTRRQNETRLDEIALRLESLDNETSQNHDERAKYNHEIQSLIEVNAASRKLARHFKNMCDTESIETITAEYEKIIETATRTKLTDFPVIHAVELAEKYRAATKQADLSLRSRSTLIDMTVTYAEAYQQIRNIIMGTDGNGALFGPQQREGIEHLPPEIRYGASHWSMAQKYALRLCETTIWEKQFAVDGSVLPMLERSIKRSAVFENTSLEGLNEIFVIVDRDLDAMMLPRATFYYGYFFDASTAGHFLGGIGRELLGTLLIAFCSILIALPIGVATAAYLVEMASDGIVTRILRLCISTLAGVPSIVFGLFGLAIIVEYMTGKPCILAGSITLALLVLPVIIRASEEAIRSVPHTYREASLGLGASRPHCFFSVTLPAAMPGILTGTILAISRAAGETAPLLFTCAVATGSITFGTDILMQSTPVMSYAAYDIAVGDRIAELVPYNQYGLVAVLILVVLLFNITAIILRSRITAKLRGH